MKTRKLILLFATALMMLAAGCKKEEKPGQLESIRFKQESYTIAENYLDLNLRKELETVPADIINTNKIEWAVSDESIATMNGSFLEPKRDGDVKVTATIQGKSATCNVKITIVEIEDFALEDFSVHINGTAEAPLTTTPSGISHSRFTWKTSDQSIATIDQAGTVTGVKEGTVTVTATANGKSRTCNLIVEKEPVDDITLSKSSINFTNVGDKEQLTATIIPEKAAYHKIVWSSSNTSVATVTNGLVTCTGAGDAVITATADGKEAKCTVSLQEIQATSISLTSNNDILDLQNKTKATITAQLTPSNANEKLLWEVIPEGSFSGSATITPASDGKSAVVSPNKAGNISVKISGKKTSATYKLKIAEAIGSVTDKCSNTYRTVKIGNQWWMAENLRCQKYGDNSESAGYYIPNALNFVTPPSSWFHYYCYYNENSTAIKGWSNYNKERIGVLYNWGAAVGLIRETASQSKTTDFSGNRQGICPDGWHLPKKSEWKTLSDYIDYNATKLMSDNGWYKGDGGDIYGFYALPSGLYANTNNDYIRTGYEAYFWSATPKDNNGSYSARIYNDDVLDWTYSHMVSKDKALSVRCVKN